MDELKTMDEDLTTVDLAKNGAPKQHDGPRLVKGNESEALDRVAAALESIPLFSESEMGEFRSQWTKIQTCFVDEPRGTVKDADKLVAAVMQRLAEGLIMNVRAWKSNGTAVTTCPQRTCASPCSAIVLSLIDC